MENQVLVVVLYEDLRPKQVEQVMMQIRGNPHVQLVKTFERVMTDALPDLDKKP